MKRFMFNTIAHNVIELTLPEIFKQKGVDIASLIPLEIQFGNATPGFVSQRKNECPITSTILKRLHELLSDDDYYHLTINTKIHRLEPGWYPCFPGWHCNMENNEMCDTVVIDEKIKHFVVLLGNDPCCGIETINSHQLEIEAEENWTEISKTVNSTIECASLETERLNTNALIMFRGNELYRNLPAVNKCWRYCFHATLYPENHPKRGKGTHGDINHHQQIFVNVPE